MLDETIQEELVDARDLSLSTLTTLENEFSYQLLRVRRASTLDELSTQFEGCLASLAAIEEQYRSYHKASHEITVKHPTQNRLTHGRVQMELCKVLGLLPPLPPTTAATTVEGDGGVMPQGDVGGSGEATGKAVRTYVEVFLHICTCVCMSV